MRRQDLRRQYGATDVEHLAKALYHAFHQSKGSDKRVDWSSYGDWDDEVVQNFRRYAMVVTRLAAKDARRGYGSVYYD